MSEMISITRDELAHLEERVRKSAMDKSYLQLVIRLINRVSTASGLEDTVDAVLRNVIDVVGGVNIILYYWIDSDIFYTDAYGKKMQLKAIDDDLVQQVIACRESIELEHPFSDTMMRTPEFTKAYTWVCPLLVGPDIIGVFKMEKLHIGMRDLYQYLPTFFSFIALILKNEILGHTRLQHVYDQSSELTAELQDSQSALMNIVEDLNEKTAELEQANAKLKEVDTLKSMFIASMSHELRTPLNSIIGFSSITLNEWTGPLNEEQKENITTVHRSGKHLLSLINDVIDVSKIETGKIESFVEEFDVHEVVMEAVETIKMDIDKKGLELTVQTCRYVLHADRRRLLQCLLNLLSNATKFTMKGSVGIYAEPSTDGSMMTIAVEDTGIGIGADDLGMLFSPFVRFHKPGDSIISGTGLGLYLTHKLLREILHGDILVTSTHGVGSRFTMRVPTDVERRDQ